MLIEATNILKGHGEVLLENDEHTGGLPGEVLPILVTRRTTDGGELEKNAVVSPLGRESVKQSGCASRLGAIEGKTIGEFWNGVFKGDQTFPIIRRLLQQKFPGVKIVPFTAFPHAPGSDHPSKQRELAQRMAELAKAQGCDAVISGNGA